MASFYVNIAIRAAGANAAITGVEKSLRSLDDQAKRTGSALNRMFGAFSAVVLIGEFISLTDTYTTLAGRIAVVTDSQGQANAVMEEAFAVADRVRVPVEAVVNTYSRLRQATETMGLSHARTLKMTETLAEGLRVNGASASEAASTMRQFTQALSKGKLNGDEFISVMENSPAIVKLVAKELKVTRGELFALAKSGKIGARTLVDALTKGADEIHAKFLKMPITIGQALTILRNNAVKFIGELTTSSGFAKGLAQGIAFVGRHFDVFAKVLLSVANILGMYFVKQGIMKAIAGLRMLAVYVATNPFTALIMGIVFVVSLLVQFGDQIDVTLDGTVKFSDVVTAAWDAIKKAVTSAAAAVGRGMESLLNAFSDGQEYFKVTFGDFLIFVAIFVDKFIMMFDVAGKAIVLILTGIPAASASALLTGVSYLLRSLASQLNLFVRGYNETIGRIPGVADIGLFKLGSDDVAGAADTLKRFSQEAYKGYAESMRKMTGSDAGPVQQWLEGVLGGTGKAKKGLEDLNGVGKDTFKPIPANAKKARDAFDQLLEHLYPVIKAMNDLRDARKTVDKELAKGSGEATLSIEEGKQRIDALGKALDAGKISAEEFADGYQEVADMTTKRSASRINQEEGNRILDRQRYILLETADALGYYNYVSGQALEQAYELTAIQDTKTADFKAEIEAREKLAELIDKGIVLSQYEIDARKERGVDTTADEKFRAEQLDNARNSAMVTEAAAVATEKATERNKRFNDRLADSASISEDYAAQLQEIVEQYAAAAAGTFDYARAVDELDKKFGILMAPPEIRVDPRIAQIAEMREEIERLGTTTALLEPIFSALNAQIVSFVTTGKASFADLVNSVLASLTQLILKVIETRIMMALLGIGMGNPAGTIVGGPNGLIEMAGYADGGAFRVAGQPGRDRNIVPLALTRGERVTVETQQQQRRNDRGSSAPPRLNVSVVNQLDPGQMVPMIGSRGGQRQIYNAMRVAPRAVSRSR